jgi:23S rRNA pseudouridine2605 synthase
MPDHDGHHDTAPEPPRTPPPPVKPGWSTTKKDLTPSSDGFRDASRGERLQKVLAAAGVGSRRTCEELVLAGNVHVNGHVVDALPAWVDAKKDHIVVSGNPIRTNAPMVYILLFKPRGVLCSNANETDHRRAIDLVAHPSRVRLFSVGRLDVDSSGLLLLTNDGALAARMTHPRYGVRKEYEVSVHGELSDKSLLRLQRGMVLADRRAHGRIIGRKASAIDVEVVHRDRGRTRLKLVLAEGRNRQVRRMMARLGHPVKKLRRLRVGPLNLKGLRPGQWRELTPWEVEQLHKISAKERPKPKRRPRPKKIPLQNPDHQASPDSSQD